MWVYQWKTFISFVYRLSRQISRVEAVYVYIRSVYSWLIPVLTPAWSMYIYLSSCIYTGPLLELNRTDGHWCYELHSCLSFCERGSLVASTVSLWLGLLMWSQGTTLLIYSYNGVWYVPQTINLWDLCTSVRSRGPYKFAKKSVLTWLTHDLVFF